MRLAVATALSLLLAHASSSEVPRAAAAADLQRARQKVPRAAWKGDNFAQMSALLTSSLSRNGHQIRPCEEWSVAELQGLQKRIFSVSEKELLDVYDRSQDNRRQRFQTLAALDAHWAKMDVASSASKELLNMRRDGLCHEAVMGAVHHVSAASLARLKADGLILPSLPTVRHEAPTAVQTLSAPAAELHAEYKQQVSCQQCHTGTIISPDWQNASLPGNKENPVDKTHPGRERLHRCNFRMEPPCGPCEGLGGKRWGDDPEQMTPMQCEILSGPDVPATTQGCYPSLGTAGLTGETRSPLEVFPTGQPGKYPPLNGTVTMGDEGGVMRLRYEFGSMGSEIAGQTLEQAKNMNPGATAGIGGGQCSCSKSIAGNFHACSFAANDTLDALKLPASEGGAAYLGRIRVHLDGDVANSQRVAIADHFLKWAFHFLVDADAKSPSFGLPLRLYGAGGVRMVFDNWKIGDPTGWQPDVWTLPKGCNITAPECDIFKQASTEVIV